MSFIMLLLNIISFGTNFTYTLSSAYVVRRGVMSIVPSTLRSPTRFTALKSPITRALPFVKAFMLLIKLPQNPSTNSIFVLFALMPKSM